MAVERPSHVPTVPGIGYQGDTIACVKELDSRHRDRRRLRDRGADLERRHGRCAPRAAALGRRAGGDQAAVARARRAALPDRGAAARRACATRASCACSTTSHDEHGDYLVMELVEGPSLATVLERARAAAGRRRRRVRPPGLRGARLRAQRARRAPRRQARQPRSSPTTGSCSSTSGSRARTAACIRTRALGTPRFAAPEVLAGAMPSPRSDVFGLAATLWALIAGRAARLPGALAAARSAREVEAALKGGLEPDPQLRVPSAEAFARALGEGIATEVGASLALSVPRPSAEPAVLETAVRAAAGVFGAAAASIAFLDDDALVYESAWGAGAEEIVGVRLEPGSGHRRPRRRVRAARGRRPLPRGPALRPRGRGPHRLRPQHDARAPTRPVRAAPSACSRSSTGSTARPSGPATSTAAWPSPSSPSPPSTPAAKTRS